MIGYSGHQEIAPIFSALAISPSLSTWYFQLSCLLRGNFQAEAAGLHVGISGGRLALR